MWSDDLYNKFVFYIKKKATTQIKKNIYNTQFITLELLFYYVLGTLFTTMHHKYDLFNITT